MLHEELLTLLAVLVPDDSVLQDDELLDAELDDAVDETDEADTDEDEADEAEEPPDEDDDADDGVDAELGVLELTEIDDTLMD